MVRFSNYNNESLPGLHHQPLCVTQFCRHNIGKELRPYQTVNQFNIIMHTHTNTNTPTYTHTVSQRKLGKGRGEGRGRFREDDDAPHLIT